jgi:uncharacterized protein (TIGR03086 family)
MRPIDELHARACVAFTEKVTRVPAERWHDATPCGEWDVHDLVDHLVAEDRWTPHLLRGETLAQVGDRYDHGVLGDDPVASAEEAGVRARAAVAEPGSIRGSVHASVGQLPAEEYVGQLFADHVIHGWDLARATGQDDAIDPELLDALVTWFADREDGYREAGVIGPPVEVGADADEQTRLLAAFGRDASWTPDTR